MGDLAMYRGDDRQLTITASESLTGSDVRFTAKYARADDEAAIAKGVNLGGVEIGDDDTTATVTLDAVDTDTITAPADLYWDVQITDSTGKIRTVAAGKLVIKADVTR